MGWTGSESSNGVAADESDGDDLDPDVVDFCCTGVVADGNEEEDWNVFPPLFFFAKGDVVADVDGDLNCIAARAAADNRTLLSPPPLLFPLEDATMLELSSSTSLSSLSSGNNDNPGEDEDF